MNSLTTMPGRRRRVGGAALAGMLGLVLGGAPALAQTEPSENLAVNLVRLLVKQGVITQAAADQLIAQAERQTAEARAEGPGTAPVATNLPPPAPGATRIPYVPEIVKNQIRDEVRSEVIEEAKAENWAQPNAIPEWTKRIQVSGDVRFRDEYDLYSKNNVNDVINFAALNANGPIDINQNTNLSGVPILNTTADRANQLIIRARLDIAAQVSDTVTADIRLASGGTNTPVSTSQLLGGGLTKKDFWLDRAYINFQPVPWIGATFGRIPNPYLSTDLVYDTDLNFDGIATSGKLNILPQHGVSLFGTAGAFLTQYSDVNFPDNSTDKSGTGRKFMFGYQAGAQWTTNRFDWKSAVAYYEFQNSEGQLSTPCALYTGITQCSTDFSAPAFMQKGNTLFLIRDIVPNPASPGNFAEPQLAGLTFAYHVLDLTSSFDFRLNSHQHLILVGDYARNMAYSAKDACRYGELGLPVTNVVSAAGSTDTDVCTAGSGAKFESGPNAYMVQAIYGDKDPFSLGEWNITVGYKHLDPDSVLDAFTDADFHLGGTNAKGYFAAATFGLLDGSNIQGRWFAADAVSGPPLSIDVGQIDLNVRF